MPLIDYNLPNPAQAITSGLKLGTLWDQGQQQKIAARNAQQANEAMQEDINAVLAKGAPVAADYAALTVKHPHLNKQFQQAWDMIDEGQKTNRVAQVSEVYAALDAGETGIAQDLLESNAQAAENSGDQNSAKGARVLSELINTSPGTAKTSIALRLSAMMGPDKFTETFTKLEASRRAKQLEESTLTTAESKAVKASVDADFAESNAAVDLQKKGWDISKIQSDMKVAKENSKIAALNAQLKREQNQLKREEMEVKLSELKRKRDVAVQERSAEVSTARTNIDNMLNNVDRILQLPAGTIEDATGSWDGSWIGGVIDSFDQDVQDFKALLENLDAQAFLAQVPQMKGLGALSENEGKKLSGALQSFNRKQSTPQFIKNLKEAQRLMQKSRSNLSAKYGVPDTVPDTPAAQPTAKEIDDLLKQYGGS